MKTKKLNYAYLGNGLTFWEENDKEYKGHIDYDRKVKLYGKFTPENSKRIYEIAVSYNTTVGNQDNQLALCALNQPTLGFTNPVTREVYRISVEQINGKEQLVYQGYIMKVKREECVEL